jgi:hypothetical protein
MSRSQVVSKLKQNISYIHNNIVGWQYMRKLAFLFMLLSLFYSCSSQGENLTQSTRGKNQPSSSIEQVRKALDVGHQAVFVKEPTKWNLDDKNYIYAEGCEVKTTELNPDEIISDLKGRVLTHLAEQLEITIESVFFSQLEEDNDGISDYKKSIIKTYSNAKFTRADFELIISPQMANIKNGVNICVKARLNEKKYKDRLEREKRTSELTASDELESARIALEQGNMSQCLTRLTKCKYYVDIGGGEMMRPYYKDNSTERSVSSQHEEMLEDIRKLISFEVVGHSDITKITFTERENRTLTVRLYSKKGGHIDYRGIDLELISESDNSVIKCMSPMDENGQTIFDFSGISLSSEKENYTLRPSFVHTWINDDHEWEQSGSYKNYLAKFRITQLGLLYNPFPRNNILPAISFGKGIHLTQIDAKRVHSELRSLIASDSRFFNLLAPGTGLSESELLKVLSADRMLSKRELNRLEVCNMILLVSIEKRVKEAFEVSISDRYELSLSLQSVVGESIVVLGSTKLEGNYSEAEIPGALQKLYKKFMDDYFYKTIKIESNVKIKHNYSVDGIPLKSTPKENESLLKDLSRYHPLNILHEHPDYRPVRFSISPDNFSHSSTNMSSPQSKVITSSRIMLVPKSGSLKVNTFDKDTGEQIKQHFRLSSSKLYQTRFFIIPWNSSKKDSNNVTYRELTPGYYTVIATENGYTPPLPKIQYVYDDLEHPEPQNINFYLSRKSTLLAVGLTTLAPGAGHYYMDKPPWQIMVPAATYVGAIVFTWKSYNTYNSSRILFSDLQSSYMSETDPVLADQYRAQGDRAFDDMRTARTNALLGLGSIIATNALTNAILIVQKKFDK